MNKKEIAILAVLAMIGVGIAFVYAGMNIGMMEKVKSPSKIEEIPGQNETETEVVPKLTEVPLEEIIIGKNGTDEMQELTEEQKEKAKEIALSDPEVKKEVEGKKYEIKISSMKMISIKDGETMETTGISVNFEFEDGTRMNVLVDLDKEEVTRRGPVIKPQMMR